MLHVMMVVSPSPATSRLPAGVSKEGKLPR